MARSTTDGRFSTAMMEASTSKAGSARLGQMPSAARPVYQTNHFYGDFMGISQVYIYMGHMTNNMIQLCLQMLRNPKVPWFIKSGLPSTWRYNVHTYKIHGGKTSDCIFGWRCIKAPMNTVDIFFAPPLRFSISAHCSALLDIGNRATKQPTYLASYLFALFQRCNLLSFCI